MIAAVLKALVLGTLLGLDVLVLAAVLPVLPNPAAIAVALGVLGATWIIRARPPAYGAALALALLPPAALGARYAWQAREYGKLLAWRPAPAAPQAGARGGANLILITVDTLRRDALSVYGGGTPTPGIARLARGGVAFPHAYALSNHTPPSMAGLLAGRAPLEIAVGRVAYEVPESLETPAERLAKAGYRSAALVGNYGLVAGLPGVMQGFDDRFGIHHKHQTLSVKGIQAGPARLALPPFFVPPRPIPDTTAALLDRATAFLDAARGPFLLWVHFMDPHDPFAPPPAFSRPADPELGAVVDFNRFEETGVDLLEGVRSGRRILSDAQKAYVRDQYLGEVRYVDEAIGRLLEQVDRLGLSEKTIVALTADHGEEFFEHGSLSHGQSFHDVLVNVPLIVRGPGVAGSGRIAAETMSHVGLLDALSGAALGEEAKTPEGRRVQAALRGTAVPDAPAFMERGALNQQQVAMVSGGMKFLYDASRDSVLAVEADTWGARRRPTAAELTRARLTIRDHIQQATARSRGSNVALDAAAREVLRSLGYVQ